MRISDWSSDVCSSDLRAEEHRASDQQAGEHAPPGTRQGALGGGHVDGLDDPGAAVVAFGDDDRVVHLQLALAREVHQREQQLRRTARLVEHDGEDLLGARSVGIGGGREVAHTATLPTRSEEHTSELQSLMRISYAVFCLKKKNNIT